MGEKKVQAHRNGEELRNFTKALLDDVEALKRIIAQGLIEADVRRVGAEQEMFLVDRDMRPSFAAMEVLDRVDHPQVSTELGLFNLEINLSAREFTGTCLSDMEQEDQEILELIRQAAEEVDTHILLTGILPTLRHKELTLDSMTPHQRYRELNHAMKEHRGGEFRMVIRGLDELSITHDNVMFEACNTSFQIHFQVTAEEFAKLYNLAQAITAPVLAAAVNSPVLLQHRLWKETRMALFEQSIDTRSEAHQARQARPRVIFGDRWLEDSVIELYQDDIARFRILLSGDLGDSSLEQLDRGEIPPLKALCLHNGTVYRWNRPCFGIVGSKPHLRIEHRVLPSGPTVLDEMANAAFFFGLMAAVGDKYGDVTSLVDFDDIKMNFNAAARYGMKARFQWLDGKVYPADELILQQLLPLAREGLESKKIDRGDVERYLAVMENRVRTGRTGSQWSLESLSKMDSNRRPEERHRALTASMYKYHLEGKPVHEWPLARLEDYVDWRANYHTVQQVMTTDLFTLHPDDLVDLAASVMDWENIRHLPVEDREGRLVGLVSHRHLLRLVAKGKKSTGESVAVRDIMIKDPTTVTPDTGTLEAIELMRDLGISCLPVVEEENKLVGIVSERDFINVAARLLEDSLRHRERRNRRKEDTKGKSRPRKTKPRSVRGAAATVEGTLREKNGKEARADDGVTESG